MSDIDEVWVCDRTTVIISTVFKARWMNNSTPWKFTFFVFKLYIHVCCKSQWSPLSIHYMPTEIHKDENAHTHTDTHRHAQSRPGCWHRVLWIMELLRRGDRRALISSRSQATTQQDRAEQEHKLSHTLQYVCTHMHTLMNGQKRTCKPLGQHKSREVWIVWDAVAALVLLSSGCEAENSKLLQPMSKKWLCVWSSSVKCLRGIGRRVCAPDSVLSCKDAAVFQGEGRQCFRQL